MRGGFIALSPVDHEAGAIELSFFDAELKRIGWTCRAVSGALHIYTSPGSISQVLPIDHDGGFIFGDIFTLTGQREDCSLPLPRLSNATEKAQTLLRRWWGRYVALLQDPLGRLGAVVRDPSGAIDCVSWRTGGLWGCGSVVPDVMLKWITTPVGIDWTVLRWHLADPSTIPVRSALLGLDRLAPGAMRRPEKRNGKDLQIWRPARFATGPLPAIDPAIALRDAVDLSISALAPRSCGLIAEVSGGLDSSIVATGLKACGANVRLWLHFATNDPAGDERNYAQALAAQLGVALSVHLKGPYPIKSEDIAQTQAGLLPSLNGLDLGYDLAVLKAARRISATAVLTGLGGDAVFFQMRHRLIARDLVRDRGLRALISADMLALARLTRTSIYRLMWMGLASDIAGGNARPSWLSDRPADFVHPWLEDAQHITPAKQLQLIGLTHMLLAYTPSRRSAELDLIHPLLAQPVLETSLAIPIGRLVEGGRERGLARRAFADRLPALLVSRRSKGDVTKDAAASIAMGLANMRDFLMQGRLVANGLIDPVELNIALREETFASSGGQLEVLRAVAIEAWVQHWEAKIASIRRIATAEFGSSDQYRQ